jgi:hypothetical protein
MTATLTFGPPEAAVGRATFTALAARETRRFARNPVFLFAVAITPRRRGPARALRPPTSTP